MMADVTVEQSPLLSIEIQKHVRKTAAGRIKTGALSKSSMAVKWTMLALVGLTVLAFASFDYKNINFLQAVVSTFHNVGIVFTQPKLSSDTFTGILYQLLITFCLGTLATIFGAIIAFFGALLCAKNIANPHVASAVKSIVAFIRAVPTILWVLIFAVSAGLGSVAAVAGLTFHSAAYLIKAYAESIEEMDKGTIEALKASGANFWQIVFQAILPSSIRYMVAWTFMRFEINFTNALAMGAAAGAGGIGYNLFMAGSFYLDLHEMGFLTYIIVAAVIMLEMAATRVKAMVK
jgi:phosphonate transport system permease protein